MARSRKQIERLDPSPSAVAGGTDIRSHAAKSRDGLRPLSSGHHQSGDFLHYNTSSQSSSAQLLSTRKRCRSDISNLAMIGNHVDDGVGRASASVLERSDGLHTGSKGSDRGYLDITTSDTYSSDDDEGTVSSSVEWVDDGGGSEWGEDSEDEPVISSRRCIHNARNGSSRLREYNLSTSEMVPKKQCRSGGFSNAKNAKNSVASAAADPDEISVINVERSQCTARQYAAEVEDIPLDSTGRRILRLRIARNMMPYRWADPPPPFTSCLNSLLVEPESAPDNSAAGKSMSALNGVLHGAMAGDEVSEETWLTSSFIDVVLSMFAVAYPNVHFMPIEFAAFRLRGMTKPDMEVATDIIGRKVDYNTRKPVIFLANIKNLHWNLLRVQHVPVAELQLFEPMGKPAKRTSSSRHASEGVSFRYIPKEVYHWLDTMWPLRGPYNNDEAWVQRSYSAITRQQQTTGFDCGVASLLYAEKCGQNQMREEIDEWTTQTDMTSYRQQLCRYRESLASRAAASRDQKAG